MFRRRSFRLRKLRKAGDDLQRVHRTKTQSVDVRGLRKQMHRLITRDLAHEDMRDDLLKEIDMLVHSHVAEWMNELSTRHDARLHNLDKIGIEVEETIAELLVLSVDERKKLTESEGVAFHVWDRVAEPDLPHVDPLR